MADHQKKLESCDGLLLYWGQSSDGWFHATSRDLAARRFRSGAIAVGSQERSGVKIPGTAVIPLYPDFRYEALDPFLQPLRQ